MSIMIICLNLDISLKSGMILDTLFRYNLTILI